MALTAQDKPLLAHLLRRAGFGARPSEWQEYEELGVAGSTERLLHPERVPDHLDELLQTIGGDYVDFDDLNSIRNWWIYRMVHTRRPLEEKMTLFWHNHFATSNYKVQDPRLMWRQNELFRRHGMGNFRTLLQHVSRDPAMLVWLDGAQNRAGRANENYGRELLELFTMGAFNGYTEADVKAAARAFTGWQRDNEGGSFFNPALHDDGVKTFLGQTGNWHGDDIIDIVVRHHSTPRFIAGKLFRYLVHDDPSSADIESITQGYFKEGCSIFGMLDTILKSESFRSEKARFANIKSPVEFAVCTIRSLDAPLSTADNLSGTLALMGQELFDPPNVKGWPGGKTWINTRTLLARVNFATSLTYELSRRGELLDRIRGEEPAAPLSIPSLKGSDSGAGGAMGGSAMGDDSMGASMEASATPDAMGMAAPVGGRAPLPKTAEEAVDLLWETFLPGHTPSAATRAALVDYVNGSSHRPNIAAKMSGLVNLVVSAPEYQLC